MSELHYRTTISIPGPWLIEGESLVSLDELLTHELAILDGIRKRELNNEVKRSLSRLRAESYFAAKSDDRKKEAEKENKAHVIKYSEHRHVTREVVVALANGQKVKAESFSEILRVPEAQSGTVESCEVEIRCGEFRASIAFPKYYGQSMEISVSPPSKEAAAQFFVRIEQWAQSNASPKWVRMWRDLHPLPLTIAPAILGALSLAGVSEQVSTPDIRESARNLLKADLTTEEQAEAFQLILSSIAASPAPQRKMVAEPWFVVAAGITALMCVLLWFPPKSAIGIGTGVRSIKRWRTWLWIVSVVIPGFAFMGVFSSIVGSALFESLRPYFAE